jgi:creatinine amidohydrolase
MLTHYLKCRPIQLQQAITDFPLALVPFGALEWHGPHLPLGLDALKAEQLLLRVGERLKKGVLFPLYYYANIKAMNFPYTFHLPSRSIKKTVKLMASQLYGMGFRIIIFLTGHYPAVQVKNMEKVAKKLMRKHPDAFILAIPEQKLLHPLGYYGDHAAKWETSFAMALFPDLVQLDALPSEAKYIDRARKWGVMGENPVGEDGATQELEIQALETFVDSLMGLINQTTENQSQEPFLNVYRDPHAAFKELYQLKNLESSLKIAGMESKGDGFDHLKWTIFHNGCQDPWGKLIKE